MNMSIREMDFWRNNLRNLLRNEVAKNEFAESTEYYVDFIIEKFNEMYETDYHAFIDAQKNSILLLSEEDDDLVTYLMKMIKISLPAGIDVHVYQRID